MLFFKNNLLQECSKLVERVLTNDIALVDYEIGARFKLTSFSNECFDDALLASTESKPNPVELSEQPRLCLGPEGALDPLRDSYLVRESLNCLDELTKWFE